MNAVSPFRITPEDLAGLDSKTRDGLQPLLNALNVVLTEAATSINSTPNESIVDVALQVDATVASAFPLVFRHALTVKPRVVLLANIVPKDADHVMTAPFVMQGFGLTDNGLVSIPYITGLLALNAYQLTFVVR